MKAENDSFPQSNQQKDLSLNTKILYRAYDLILSWPLPETAVSNEQEAMETVSSKSPNSIQEKEECPPV